MISLSKIEIFKYKSFQSHQVMDVNSDITTIVGMNESGKTGILEMMAKTNYFEEDERFKFNSIYDYPRKDLKKFQRAGEKAKVISCEFFISDELINKIANELGEGVFTKRTFEVNYYYDNSRTIANIDSNLNEYLSFLASEYGLMKEEVEKLKEVKKLDLLSEIVDDSASPKLKELNNHVESKMLSTNSNWTNKLDYYIYSNFLKNNMPKFWYYDEYFSLPSRINLNQLKNNTVDGNETAKALLEVAQIDLDELIGADNFENFIAELEATSIEITDQMFKYWSANTNLDIDFKIEKLANQENILDIRVRNQKHRISLPLNQRSKGFNWFFSFIVWFSKIQNDDNSTYILLLDEPGLNLHASAQKDLLNFIEDLADNYQVIYTTHSPFLVDSKNLHRVRTVYEGEEGSIVSDSIQEKDSNTLFPLQAALGYNLAQNLFVAESNLLVEGPADLIYLNIMSDILIKEHRIGLKEDIVIVPIGGLDKIPAFISLMTGNKLNMVAVVDSFNNQQGKQKLNDMIRKKIIKESKIRFFDEFVEEKEKADIEDLFTVGEYLKFFKAAYPEQNIKAVDIANKKERILPQINAIIDQNRFNHYLPSKEALKMNLSAKSFSEETLNRFEKMFITINSLY